MQKQRMLKGKILILYILLGEEMYKLANAFLYIWIVILMVRCTRATEKKVAETGKEKYQECDRSSRDCAKIFLSLFLKCKDLTMVPI